MSTEPTYFLTLMNNDKAFPSLDSIACNYQCSDQFQVLPGHWQAKVLDFLRPYMKSQIQKKSRKNGGIVEWLLPILNKIIRNQDTYFVVIMNNLLKIISVYGAPLWIMGAFFPKKAFHEGRKTFLGKKIMGRLF